MSRGTTRTRQHGAGRAMCRTAARKAKTSDAVYAEMADLGVVLRSSEPKRVAEEAACASPRSIERLQIRPEGGRPRP